MKIDLLDPRLFGNEAGDDEDEETLAAYFVEKPEFKAFEASQTRLAVCRARKGMGKSALLNYIAYSKSLSPANYVFRIKGPTLITEFLDQPDSSQPLTNHWRTTFINFIGGRFQQILTDDPAKAQTMFQRIAETPEEAIRATPASNQIWLCIDDIDATYRRSEEEDSRLATFFSACRFLVTEFPNVRLRISVREDVWSSIRAHDEALDKCEQYMLDIRWSRTEMRTILANRIRHFLAVLDTEIRNPDARDDIVVPDAVASAKYSTLSDSTALSEIFPHTYPWGNGTIQQFHVIHVFAAGRPRWALQLSRMTAGIANKHYDTILKFGYMKEILPRYSQFRITDLIREHTHQCPQIEELVYSFSSRDTNLSTAALLTKVEQRVTRLLDVFIDGSDQPATILEICHFLFRIGFIEAIDLNKLENHYNYDDSPHLLKTITAQHDHIKWQVRPSYTAVLN